MGPFPHDAPPAVISADNPMGTDGFEFVEYAHPNPGELHALFRLMGYVPVARHKTKKITVYRQGDINYLVNEEPGTHGYEFVAAHGPCAPSMAFRVVDAKAAYDRAISLGAEPADASSAQKTLDDLTGTAHEGQATLGTLRPTADNLKAISDELQKFTDSANPALKSANPLLDKANQLLDEARPLANQLRATGGPLLDTVHDAQPVVDSLKRHLGGPYGPGPNKVCGDDGGYYNDKDCQNPRIQGILGFIHNWALVTNHGDALQHYFRVFFVVDDELLETGFGAKASNPAAGTANPAARNTVLPSSDPRPGGSATGLNLSQEQNALGTLMGGR